MLTIQLWFEKENLETADTVFLYGNIHRTFPLSLYAINRLTKKFIKNNMN